MSQTDTVSTPALPNGGAFPERGQLVEVRRRQWIVDDVGASAFRELFATSRQGLVSLVSVDEDSLGENLEVIWQLEPGARVLDRAGLPVISGCDDAARLEAFLDAVRWGAATNADRNFLQSPFRSGASIESYQLDPVVRAIDMARVNLLIADDVGLGKTIEAGLVIQELLVRHRARTVLVVCPSSLQLKWQLEMQEKFGLEFRVVDTEYLKSLRREQGIHANPWTSFPRLITSMDWMKSGEALRLIKDVLPPHITYPRKFDILVVDEAHNVAPAMPAIAHGGGDAIKRTRDVAAELQKLIANPPIIEEIKKVTADYLGCYLYPPRKAPWIEIYWMPIALIAAMIDVRMEDLTVVTLAHELGHGYTHLGRDIDGASWDTVGFAKSAPEVKEGLAQFYTEVVTQKIASRQPGAHEAYEKFLAMQSGPYLAHMEWLKEQAHQRSETIRFALLASRTKGVVKQDEWLTALTETNQKLRKPASPAGASELQ